MNSDANTKDFVYVNCVDVNARGNVQASGQCRCMDMGKSGVAAVRHGAFAMEAGHSPQFQGWVYYGVANTKTNKRLL